MGVFLSTFFLYYFSIFFYSSIISLLFLYFFYSLLFLYSFLLHFSGTTLTPPDNGQYCQYPSHTPQTSPFLHPSARIPTNTGKLERYYDMAGKMILPYNISHYPSSAERHQWEASVFNAGLGGGASSFFIPIWLNISCILQALRHSLDPQWASSYRQKAPTEVVVVLWTNQHQHQHHPHQGRVPTLANS